MKKIVLLLLIFCFLFAGCDCDGEAPVASAGYALTSPSRGVFVCAENGVTYTRRPACYLPMALSRTPYATYTSEAGAVSSFYSLSEGSEERYLMLADPDDLYPYYLIAAEDYELPSLAEMDPHQILICTAEEEFFWLTPNIYDQIRTLEVVRRIVAGYGAGKAATLPALEEPTVCVELLFVSAIYPDFAYNCTYMEYKDGSCYFTETETGLCLLVEGGLFDGYHLTPEV